MNTEPAPKMKGRLVMDRDGDVWQRLSGGHWRCITADSFDQAGADLLNVCGPLYEIASAAQVAEEIRLELAKDYTEGSELVDDLSAYDKGLADAENCIALVRDRYRLSTPAAGVGQ